MSMGTRNIGTLNAPGAACMLCDKLESGNISIMGLQEVCWSGADKMQIDKYHWAHSMGP